MTNDPDIPEELAALDNATEEIVELPGGWDPAKIAADVEKNAAHKARVLASPATPEEREAQRLYTAALADRAANVGLVGMPPRQRRLVTAVTFERAALEMLSALADQPDAADYAERFRHAALGLANALYLQGRFDEALEWCPEEEELHRATFAEMRDAELAPDNAICACDGPKVEARMRMEGYANPVTRTLTDNAHSCIGEFPSVRRNCWVYAIRCHVCGDLNLRKDLTESAAAEANARAPRSAPRA